MTMSALMLDYATASAHVRDPQLDRFCQH